MMTTNMACLQHTPAGYVMWILRYHSGIELDSHSKHPGSIPGRNLPPTQSSILASFYPALLSPECTYSRFSASTFQKYF